MEEESEEESDEDPVYDDEATWAMMQCLGDNA